MADILIIAALACWLLFVFCVWQALRLLGTWQPAPAMVWRSDYTEGQQSEDFWSFGMTMFTSRGWNWRDGDDTRYIEDEIRFRDSDGIERRALVHRWVHRGWKPSGAYTVWYDPADPTRATVLGPFTWGAWAVLSLLLLCIALHAVKVVGLPPVLAAWLG
ncbi:MULTISPECIES: DUF3592 domain-containing protein [unclassified Novosphingobium]|uniref:DUF3592 domain-containing protein n=1 Tax=Novosphingobium TaxID=165696 RepID=UPI00144734DC|nr:MULTISPECIES: DUF3592 domain-containing protein [unclassified Novosphingobium]NKJ43219.1 hypothetical protein [Novosphingobium sp. SG720]NMN07088.1 hypothetical protein [Novosphingobium sp. SG919]NMN89324.1 hypothetical protein [Novosphingobium sp. SG916]